MKKAKKDIPVKMLPSKGIGYTKPYITISPLTYHNLYTFNEMDDSTNIQKFLRSVCFVMDSCVDPVDEVNICDVKAILFLIYVITFGYQKDFSIKTECPHCEKQTRFSKKIKTKDIEFNDLDKKYIKEGTAKFMTLKRNAYDCLEVIGGDAQEQFIYLSPDIANAPLDKVKKYEEQFQKIACPPNKINITCENCNEEVRVDISSTLGILDYFEEFNYKFNDI